MFSKNTKPRIPAEKPSYSAQLTMNMFISAFVTFSVHPFRVLLNEASVNTNPFKTVKSASNKMFRDAPLNILRGTSSTALQSTVKHVVNQYYAQDTSMGRITSVIGTTIAGVTVTPIEVAFMRKNALRSTLPSLQPSKLTKPSLLKYNLPILALFGLREVGFTSSIFGTDDLPFYQRLPVLLPSALITAITHKLASIEITKDIRQITHLVPDYRIGFRAVIHNIAYGGVYKHESFRVPITHPKSMPQFAINFLSATCGYNMYFWRLTYLAVFAGLLSFLNQEISRLYNNKQEQEEQIEPRSYKMK